jgi:hypothetical protein
MLTRDRITKPGMNTKPGLGLLLVALTVGIVLVVLQLPRSHERFEEPSAPASTGRAVPEALRSPAQEQSRIHLERVDSLVAIEQVPMRGERHMELTVENELDLPIPAACASLQWEGGLRDLGTTGENGVLPFAIPEETLESKAQLAISAEGYRSLVLDIDERSPDALVARLGQGCSIRGAVRQRVDQSLVSGALVLAFPRGHPPGPEVIRFLMVGGKDPCA